MPSTSPLIQRLNAWMTRVMTTLRIPRSTRNIHRARITVRVVLCAMAACALYWMAHMNAPALVAIPALALCVYTAAAALRTLVADTEDGDEVFRQKIN